MSLFRGRQLPVWLFLLLVLLAGLAGVRTTRGLDWPGVDWGGVGIDLYRDIASAQTMIAEGYGPDPTYLGERTWYNPLTPAITAIVSLTAGQPVHRVATQIGAYLNLLAPIAFFLMCAALFDRWTALFATAGFLFLVPGSLPSWISATYSPWFLPVNFVQTVFYLTVIALARAARGGRGFTHLLAGALWGLTFLGHTAPALILGGMATLGVAQAAWTSRRVPTLALRRYALLVTVALIVSLPMATIIAGHYGLRVRNPAPSAYSDPLLSRELPRLIWLHVSVPTLVALVGLVALVRRRRAAGAWRTSRLVILGWICSAGLFLAYGFARLGAKVAGVTLPSIVPSFHFFFYLKAAAAVLFGIGLMAIGRAVAAWLIARQRAGQRAGQPATGGRVAVAGRQGLSPRARAVVIGGRAAGAALCLVLLLLQAPTYLARPDFGAARRDALAVSGSDQARTFDWMRSHLGPEDVVLAADDDAATIVAPSGAKVVAIFTGFSNPYVDFESRRDARDRLFAALDQDNAATFRQLAEPYRVGWVLTRGARSERFDVAPPEALDLAFSAGDRRVYRVRSTRIFLARR